MKYRRCYNDIVSNIEVTNIKKKSESVIIHSSRYKNGDVARKDQNSSSFPPAPTITYLIRPTDVRALFCRNHYHHSSAFLILYILTSTMS